MFEEPDVFAAAINGGFTLIAALVAAITAGILGRRFINQERVKSKLYSALADINFYWK